jgi:integrase
MTESSLASRKPATCSGAICMLEATPARLRSSARTVGHGRFPCQPRFWGELIGRRGTAKPEEPVFRSRSGKALDRGRVRVILRRAAQRAGVVEGVSPHWLRHAHASHALDHGAPIHLVQATLGHSSVATTSRYLHARPGDSSERFLAMERFSAESGRIALPSYWPGWLKDAFCGCAKG